MTSWRLDRTRLLDLRLALGMILPAIAGLAVFGWRAIGVWAFVLAGALVTRFFLLRLRTWPVRMGRFSLAVQATLLSLLLPATWCDIDHAFLVAQANWPLALGAGALLAFATWAVKRAGTARASPVVLTLLLVIALAPLQLRTDRVLQRDDVARGDLLDSHAVPRSTSTAEPWLLSATVKGSAAYILPPAIVRLDDYLHGRVPTDRPALTISRLISDDMPPLEDLMIGGHPRRTGMASAIAVVIGGLFLIHRRVVAFRVPALMLMTIFLVILAMPVPIVVSRDEIVRRWFALGDPRVGWAMGVTFANYIFFASPALLVTFFLAAQPGVRPLGGRAAVTFAVLFGALCGAAMVLISVEHGPIIALALAQFVSPSLEHRLPQRPIV
jgi:Na+-translocating ferredoxin:NAD+ oxidoreductase RnfD subunit